MNMGTAEQRTMKDFLELYNKLVHHCFDKCVSNFNHAKTSEEELSCVNVCADKCVLFNQRHMMVFVEHQNAKHKAAALAAEAQQAAAAQEAASTLPVPAGETTTPPAQEDATLAPATASTVEQSAEDGAPMPTLANVCGLAGTQILAQPATRQTDSSSQYSWKRIVDQFLGDDTRGLKFV